MKTDTLLKLTMPRELRSEGNQCGKVLPVVRGFMLGKDVDAPWTKSVDKTKVA